MPRHQLPTYEGSLRLGVTTSDPVLRSWLDGLTGGSKAARAARALLAGS